MNRRIFEARLYFLDECHSEFRGNDIRFHLNLRILNRSVAEDNKEINLSLEKCKCSG
jgi:hypothetical protein